MTGAPFLPSFASIGVLFADVVRKRRLAVAASLCLLLQAAGTAQAPSTETRTPQCFWPTIADEVIKR